MKIPSACFGGDDQMVSETRRTNIPPPEADMREMVTAFDGADDRAS